MENKKLFLLFSHKLTKEQEEELKIKWNCENFIYLPKGLQEKWSNSEPEENGDIFKEYLIQNAQHGDLIFIQGEWGLTYKMIQFAKKQKFITIYSYSRREAIEKVENSYVTKISKFKHISFFEYQD